MSKYGLSDVYVRKEEEIIKGMTREENRKISMKYIKPIARFILWLAMRLTR